MIIQEKSVALISRINCLRNRLGEEYFDNFDGVLY